MHTDYFWLLAVNTISAAEDKTTATYVNHRNNFFTDKRLKDTA
jgi:hypothetical protein